MIRHVLLFKFNEGVSDEEQMDAYDRLLELGELCPTIGHWAVGRSIADSPSGLRYG